MSAPLVVAGNGNSSVDDFNLAPYGSIGRDPLSIAMDPDGSVWFIELNSNQIGHLSPTGDLTQYQIPDAPYGASPRGIVRGPDGNYWFTMYSYIGKIVPATGAITLFELPTRYSRAMSITVGPDNNLWFTEGLDAIGKITTDGHVTEYKIGPGTTLLPSGITSGPDGKLWFTEGKSDRVASISTSGTNLTEYQLPPLTTLDGITAGPDGNIWFTDNGTIGRMSPGDGSYVLFDVPQAVELRRISQDRAGGLVFSDGNGIGRIDTAGKVAFLAARSANGVTVSSDNSIWYTDVRDNSIERVAPNYFTRAPGELYGESNPAEPGCRHCLAGDPVDVATGNLTEKVTDLAVPARGVPLAFTRTYNALDAATAASAGPLGWGWTFGYNASLSMNSAGGTVTVRNGNGSTVQFVPNATGYSAPARVIATLVHNVDGTYTYTLPNQTSEIFSAGGRLQSLVDRNGYRTSLSYTSGQLGGISDPSGRTMGVGWTGAHITSLTSPLGRVTQYGYDAAGNLASVKTPGLNTTLSDYDAQHRLSKITRPRGGIVVTVYDAATSRVKNQTDERGRKTVFAYSPGQTTVTDPANHARVFTLE